MNARTTLLLILAISLSGCDLSNVAGYQNVEIVVWMKGTGLGRVSSDEALDFDCHKSNDRDKLCGRDFQDAGLGGNVTFFASADPGSRFDGWTGECSGIDPVCQISFDGGPDVRLEATALFSIDAPGHIDVTTSTTGADLDPDGYTVAIGSRLEPVPSNGTTRIAGVAAGQHTVDLSGIAVNCAVTGANPASAAVASGQVTAVDFDVVCAATGDIAFEDDFSTGTQWTTTVMQTSHGAWQHGVQNVASGGNPDGYRRMTHTMTQTTAPDFAVLTVRHIYTGASYDPSTQGAIRFIDYAEDRIEIDKPSAGAEVASAFIVVQGGVAYTKSLSSFGNDTWQTATLTSLTASDFSPAPGPDFSATGAPLQFGYQRANSSRFPIVLTHGIDNWRVTIRR